MKHYDYLGVPNPRRVKILAVQRPSDTLIVLRWEDCWLAHCTSLWLDAAKEKSASSGADDATLEILAGPAVPERIEILPAILISVFAIIFFMHPKRPAKYAHA